MKFDIDKVIPQEEAVEFFKENKFKVIATCMRLKASTEAISEEETKEIQKEAMNIVSAELQFGPYRHLCNTCRSIFPECKATPADIMYGWDVSKDNICFCNLFESTIEKE